MGKKRSITKRIVFGLLLIAGAIALTMVLAALPPGERILKQILQAQLSERLQRNITIGTLETNILSYVHVEEIRVLENNTFDSNTLLRVNDFTLEYDLWRLFYKEFRIKSIVADTIGMFIHRDSLRSFDFPLLHSITTRPSDTLEDTGEPASNVVLRSLRLTNVSIIYADDVVPMRATIPDLSVLLAHADTSGYYFEASCDNGRVQYNTGPPSSIRLLARGRWAHQLMNLDTLWVQAEKLQLSAFGEIQLTKDFPLSARFTLRGNPNSVLQATSDLVDIPAFTVNGDFSVEGNIDGTLDAPTFNARVGFSAAEVANTHIEKCFIEAHTVSDSIMIDSIHLEAFGGSLLASGYCMVDTAFRCQVAASANNVDMSSVWSWLYDEASPYQGAMSGEFSIDYKGKEIHDWRIIASACAPKARYRSQPLPGLCASLSLSAGLARMKIQQQDSNVEATARIDDKRLKGHFSMNVVNLEPLAGFFHVMELTGAVQGSGTILGSLDSPIVEARINGEGINFQNFPIDAVAAQVRYAEHAIMIEELEFSGSVNNIDPANPPFHIDSIGGGFRYAGNASGKLNDLRGQLEIHLSRPTYGSLELDSASFSIHMDRQRITLATAKVYKSPILLHGEGDYRLPSSRGKLTAKAFNLLARAEGLNADTAFQIARHSNQLGDHRLIGDLTSEFEVHETDVISLNVRGRNVDLSDFLHLLSDTIDIGGELQFDFNFKGTLDRPDVSVIAKVRNPRYENTSMDSVTMITTFLSQEFRVEELKAFHHGERLSAFGNVEFHKDSEGKFVLSKQSRIEGSAKLSSLNLHILEPFLLEHGEVSGHGSLDLRWDGTLEMPHLTGSVALENFRLRYSADAKPVEQINLSASMLDSIIHIDYANGMIGGIPFSLNGTINTSEWQRFDANVTLALSDIARATINGIVSREKLDVKMLVDRLDVALLEPFAPKLRNLSGVLDCHLELKGSMREPTIYGVLTVQQLGFQPPMFEGQFEGGLIQLSFSKTQAQLDSLYGRFNGGTISAVGTLVHDGGEIKDIHLKASIDKVRLSVANDFVLQVRTADLQYARKDEYFLLDGDIELGESSLKAKFDPQSILPWAKSVERFQPELPAILQQTRMDVRVRESRDLWIDNNLAHLRLRAELGIVGSPAQPNLSGRISAEEGYLLYLDRKFEVMEGVIYFVHPTRIDPEINLKAEAEVTSYKGMEATTYVITFSADGFVDALNVQLSSDPLLDRPDIVALLTLGATRSQIAEKGGGLELGTSLSSRKISEYVSRGVATFLNLDQVSVEGNLFRFDKSWGPRLLVSKRMSERVNLTYSTTVGRMNDQAVRMGYRLSRLFSLEGEIDKQAKASLLLKYGLRFK